MFGCCGKKESYDTTKDTQPQADLTTGQHPVFLQQVIRFLFVKKFICNEIIFSPQLLNLSHLQRHKVPGHHLLL